MNLRQSINIYECLDQSGDPSFYMCWGHIDSERFREECFREYAIRPLVIQHQWQRSQRVLVKESKRTRFRSRVDCVNELNQRDSSKAVTIGLLPKIDSIEFDELVS